MDIDWPLATSWTYPLKRGNTLRMYLYGKKMAAPMIIMPLKTIDLKHFM